MKRLYASDVVLKVLGLLLLTAAVLKGHELLTVPVVNRDLWSWRPFLIFQVEFELALGIWLLSGLLKPLVWLASLLCFSLFCCVTLYKALTGAASCGCFGVVHVKPWITLLAVDVPAIVALSIFRPPLSIRPAPSFLRWQESMKCMVADWTKPLSSRSRGAGTAILSLVVLGITTPILALNQPANATSAYEVLEPETWVGQELPILDHIDIGEQLSAGRWLIVLYHYDCPACLEALPRIEQMARDLQGNEDFLQVALIEVPPYGRGPVSEDSPCVLGRMDGSKEWFVTTPAVALTSCGVVRAAWESEAPDLETMLQDMQ